jgi:hypothetical protein
MGQLQSKKQHEHHHIHSHRVHHRKDRPTKCEELITEKLPSIRNTNILSKPQDDIQKCQPREYSFYQDEVKTSKLSECICTDKNIKITNKTQCTVIRNNSADQLIITLTTPEKTTLKTIYWNPQSETSIQININKNETYILDDSTKAIQLEFIPCLSKWIVISNNPSGSTGSTGGGVGGTLNFWTQEGKLIGPDSFAGIGASVAISADNTTLAAAGIGEVVIWYRSFANSTETLPSGPFILQTTLYPTDDGAIDGPIVGTISDPDGSPYPYSVALSSDGNIIAIGDPNHNPRQNPKPNPNLNFDLSVGGVWIYTRSETGWNYTSTILPPSFTEDIGFGWSISLVNDGDSNLYLAIGSPNYNIDSAGFGLWGFVNLLIMELHGLYHKNTLHQRGPVH